jgi:hypothetical protein
MLVASQAALVAHIVLVIVVSPCLRIAWRSTFSSRSLDSGPAVGRTHSDTRSQASEIVTLSAGTALGIAHPMPRTQRKHPLLREPALRAMLEAAPPVADLARAIQDPGVLLGELVLACGQLIAGLGAPAGSSTRRQAYHRAWIGVRQLDRHVFAARMGRRAPAGVVGKAQRAIDRADVIVGSLPGVAIM